MSRKFLLISPPWRLPGTGDLALATLRPMLESQGIPTDTLHATLLFPRTVTDTGYFDFYAAFLFTPHLYPDCDADEVRWAVLSQLRHDKCLGGIFGPEAPPVRELGRTPRDVAKKLGYEAVSGITNTEADIAHAGVCLDRAFERASRPEYDVVGFSCIFETQLPGALALARRIKAHDPSVRVIFGGAACFEEQADGLIASFPFIDAVCHCEGEEVVAPLIRALRAGTPLADVPGVAFRAADGSLVHTAAPPLLRDLDSLPIPDYTQYFEQLEASEWGDRDPRLPFETSRGCWWGQVSLCSFCGLNSEGLAFRSKSPERAYDEIRHLYHAYPKASTLQATDNILEMKYFQTLLPRLGAMPRAPGRPLYLFYEIKANLKREQVKLLAEAGIVDVQPGIESFSDEVLKLMRKGSTALGQVQALKWLQEEGVRPIYNILLQNPGEKADWYREMAELVPFIEHLPPPVTVTPVILERFSPYFQTPEAFGIRNVRPSAYYRTLYRGGTEDVGRLAYNFQFDHDMLSDPELADAQRVFAKRMVAWIDRRSRNRAFCIQREDHLVVVDRRDGPETVGVIAGVAAAVYRSMDKVRPMHAVLREFAELDPDFVESLVVTWIRRRWLYRDPRGQCLAVLPIVEQRDVARLALSVAA